MRTRRAALRHYRAPCRRDLACFRNDGHDGEHAYAAAYCERIDVTTTGGEFVWLPVTLTVDQQSKR